MSQLDMVELMMGLSDTTKPIALDHVPRGKSPVAAKGRKQIKCKMPHCGSIFTFLTGFSDTTKLVKVDLWGEQAFRTLLSLLW